MGNILRKMGMLLITGMFLAQPVSACTGVYIGKDLTEDGSVIFGRTEDLEQSHNKTFIVVEAKQNEAGAKLVDEYTKFEYSLPEISYKYFAVPDTTPEWGLYYEAGFNEHGVAMDATTTCYTNEAVLNVDPLVENGLSEGIMTTIVLGQAKTAREGIELLAKIVEEQGSSESNGLIIADQNEAWYMEILSGHQYAAIKLPDDKFAVFPNSFFLDDVDVEDSENVIASADIKKIAEEAGTLVEADGKILVADSYAANIDMGSISRYWAGVKIINPDAEISLDTNEFPFLHESENKVSLETVMNFQRNRFEGTEYIPADNIASSTGGELEEGSEEVEESLESDEIESEEATQASDTAETEQLSEGEEVESEVESEVEEEASEENQMPDNALYPIGNKNTMEAHIFQIYEDMPAEVPGVMWLAIGSPLVSPYLPFFGNITDTAAPYKVMSNEADPSSFYWTADALLASMLADESNLKDEIREKVVAIEKENIQNFEEIRQELIAKYGEDPKAAADWITEYTMTASQKAFEALTAINAEYSAE